MFVNALEEDVGVFEAILRWGEVGVGIGFGGGVEAVVQVERIKMRFRYGSTVQFHFDIGSHRDIDPVYLHRPLLRGQFSWFG